MLALAGGGPDLSGAGYLSTCQLAPTEREGVRGIPCTTVQRALFDEVRFGSSAREAAVAVSMAAAAGLISVELFGEYVAHRNAWEGVPMARRALPLASNECRSPPECRLLHVFELDAGLPRPLINHPVFDRRGNLLGIPDLLDPEAGLVGEYDGAHHKSGPQHARDVAREDRFRDVGLEYFTVVGGDLTRRELVVRRILAARSRARFLPPTGDRGPWNHRRGSRCPRASTRDCDGSGSPTPSPTASLPRSFRPPGVHLIPLGAAPTLADHPLPPPGRRPLGDRLPCPLG